MWWRRRHDHRSDLIGFIEQLSQPVRWHQATFAQKLHPIVDVPDEIGVARGRDLGGQGVKAFEQRAAEVSAAEGEGVEVAQAGLEVAGHRRKRWDGSGRGGEGKEILIFDFGILIGGRERKSYIFEF